MMDKQGKCLMCFEELKDDEFDYCFDCDLEREQLGDGWDEE